MHTWLVGLALFALAPTSAHADAIMMPASCPAGSTDAFCHGPATCRPRGCIADTDCEVGEVCAAQALCTEPHQCFGLPMTTTVQHVLGSCDASHACPSGGSCLDIFVCSPGPMTVDAAPHMDAGVVPEHVTACGCRAGGGRSGLSLLAGLGVVVLVSRSVRTRAARRAARRDR